MYNLYIRKRMWICKYFFMYVILYIFNFLDTCSSDLSTWGLFFISSFLQIVSFVQELWVLCVGCLWWRLLPILLGFCSWMSIGWTVYFHLNFTHPCSFVILKYFGVGEIYPSKGSVNYYIILYYIIFLRALVYSALTWENQV